MIATLVTGLAVLAGSPAAAAALAGEYAFRGADAEVHSAPAPRVVHVSLERRVHRPPRAPRRKPPRR